jgi:hypothetical protein
MVCSGQYSGVTQSPYAEFLLSGVTIDGNTFQLESSLSASSSKYITKVLGVDNFGKSRYETPVFVEEVYPGSLNYGFNQGFIKGLNCQLVALPSARSQSSSSIAWNLEKYQSPETPFLVSELRGNKFYRLFKFISISDGDSANVEIKVSIGRVDIVGVPLFHALPISTTKDPSFVRRFDKSFAIFAIHSKYSSPCLFPYFLGTTNGYGGEVKIKLTFPANDLPFFDFKKSSIVELKASPLSVFINEAIFNFPLYSRRIQISSKQHFYLTDIQI